MWASILTNPHRRAGREQAREALGEHRVQVVVPALAGRGRAPGRPARAIASSAGSICGHHAHGQPGADEGLGELEDVGLDGGDRGARALGQAGRGLGHGQSCGEGAIQLGPAAGQPFDRAGRTTGAHQQVGPQPPSGARHQVEPVRELEGPRLLHGRAI